MSGMENCNYGDSLLKLVAVSATDKHLSNRDCHFVSTKQIEFNTMLTTFRYPEGLFHYLTEHNIHLSPEFISFLDTFTV